MNDCVFFTQGRVAYAPIPNSRSDFLALPDGRHDDMIGNNRRGGA